MTKINFILLSVACVLIMVSCKKEEDPRDSIYLDSINLNSEYGVKFGSIEMGSDYRYQSYFDLETNSVVGFNLKDEWDLGFSCSNEEHVILNSAKTNLRVAKFEGNWDEVIDIESLEFGYDLPSGNLDDLAIGTEFNSIYVINRGLDVEGEELGYLKFSVSYTDPTYTVTFADVDGSNEDEIEMQQDMNFNYLYLDFDEGQKLIEPEKSEYDILFTHYLYIYDPETEPFPYMVTGVLLNPNSIECAEVFDLDFDEIKVDDLSNYEFSNQRDIIGFDWKYFDFDEGFITYPEMNYVVRSTEGDRYKLHFTSFYNEDFEKGYPQYEIQKIQED